MTVDVGTRLLNQRYSIDQPVASLSRDAAQRWKGFGPTGTTFLIKTWQFDGLKPLDYQRGLWASELRTLYKVASSRNAPQTLLSLHDAGIDAAARCFVMVMESDEAAFVPLSEPLLTRSAKWLQVEERSKLWRGLRRVARGLKALHQHRLLHRALSAENVFCDPNRGPSSFRLGGFEWSVRLGVPAQPFEASDWPSPPAGTGYTIDTDWYAFGLFAARTLLQAENLREMTPAERQEAMLTLVDENRDRMSRGEYELLSRLLAKDIDRGIASGHKVAEIEGRIENIVSELGEQTDPARRDRVYLVAMSTAPRFIDQVKEALGTAEATHLLPKLVERDLAAASLAAAGPDSVVLIGERLRLQLEPWTRQGQETWDVAFCSRIFAGNIPIDAFALPHGRIVVCTTAQLQADPNLIRRARSFQERIAEFGEDQLIGEAASFYDFIRCTNQLELLMRTTEVFQFVAEDESVQEREDESRVVVQSVVAPEAPVYLRGQQLESFLQHQLDKMDDGADWPVVEVFNEQERAIVFDDVRNDDWRHWNVLDAREELGAELEPVDPTISKKMPRTGWLRAADMHGQLQLISRRSRAIEDLRNHYYLLKALSSPGDVGIDTGVDTALAPGADLPAEKADVIREILRVRPIYCLQGPPGTGKTTLVAHLVHEILREDPVAQILLTAPTNWAVDVLRRKVDRVGSERYLAAAGANLPDGMTPLSPPSSDTASSASDLADMPFAVRLYSRRPGRRGEGPREGSAETVALEILKDARRRLDDRGPPSENALAGFYYQWLFAVNQMIEALEGGTPDADTANFCELVRLGANLTYCTTSSGDLEELAKGDQTFDWSIIEEAGKSHGFDLALPMQAGHRWLLLGDQRQLEPHRIDYFDSILWAAGAAQLLDGALKELDYLEGSVRKFRDMEWLSRWQKVHKNDQDGQKFIRSAQEYLRTFEHIFGLCRALGSTPGEAPYAATLMTQYRMHPDIGELISKVYYRNIVGGLRPGREGDPELEHRFDSPERLKGRAIVWLDVPWVAPRDAEERQHVNPDEIIALDGLIKEMSSGSRYDDGVSEDDRKQFALLSPYKQQVRAINAFFADAPPSLAGLRLKEARSRGRAKGRSVAHTVDQFQGDEAHAVFVSLVRNNNADHQPREDPAAPLGFLKRASRMNVLLSRGEALLVLVGSWQFFEHVSRAIPSDPLRRDDDQELAHVGGAESPAHWKDLVRLLGEWFESGRAVRIDATPFLDRASDDVRRRAQLAADIRRLAASGPPTSEHL